MDKYQTLSGYVWTVVDNGLADCLSAITTKLLKAKE
jgi:hypothetical protein